MKLSSQQSVGLWRIAGQPPDHGVDRMTVSGVVKELPSIKTPKGTPRSVLILTRENGSPELAQALAESVEAVLLQRDDISRETEIKIVIRSLD